MTAIDKLAYGSRLAKLSPKAKMLFAAVPLMLCLTLDSLSVSIITVLFMGAVTIVFGRIPTAKYLRLLTIPLGFLLMGSVTIIFARCEPGVPVFAAFRLRGYVYGISASSMLYGLRLALKALGCVSCMYFISLNTPMNGILSALRELGLPGLMVSLMELIYRYVFVFFDEARRIRIAQDSRLGYSGFKKSLNSLGALTATLFLRTYIRCDRIYAALQSRGYEGEFKRLSREYTVSWPLYSGCVLFCLSLVMVGLWEKGVWSFL